jgi:plasmid stabilization system protein ParE
MSVPVAYLPEAVDDIEAARNYYDEQLPGLGDQFVATLRTTIDRICENPRLYGVFRRDIRAAPLRRFGYVVFYSDRGADVLIIAVQHGRRSTRAWRGRA